MIQASREVGVEKEAIESACEKGKRPSHRDFLKAKLGKDEVKMALGSRVFFVTQPRGWGWGAVSQGVCVTWVGCASGRMGFWALEMRVRRRPSSPDALRLQGSWGMFLLSFLPPERSQCQLWYLLCDLEQGTEPLDLGLPPSLRPSQALFQMTPGLSDQAEADMPSMPYTEPRAPEGH